MVGDVADLNRIINVGDHRNSCGRKQLDHAIHRLNVFPGRHHLEWNGAIGQQRREPEAFNVFGKNMEVCLKMAVGQRWREGERHFSKSDRHRLVPLVVDQKELSALPKRGLFLAGQFVIAYSDGAPKKRAYRFVIFRFVDPATYLQVPAIGLLIADSGEENNRLISFDCRAVNLRGPKE